MSNRPSFGGKLRGLPETFCGVPIPPLRLGNYVVRPGGRARKLTLLERLRLRLGLEVRA